jgi:predicted transposase/invertase (TIGR01784 family)
MLSMRCEDRFKWLIIEANAHEKYEGKGFERGLEKGREEEKIEIAKTLFAQGIDMEMTAKATKLSQEELKKFLP